VKIRPATVADISDLMHLDRQCATAAHWTLQQYVELFTSQDRLLVVAEAATPTESAGISAEIKGFLVAHHVAPEWELENIVVAPSVRRMALGKHLLGVLFAAARDTHSRAVFLEVRESNAAARTFYQRTGFEQTGRRKSYYADPQEDAVLYRKTHF